MRIPEARHSVDKDTYMDRLPVDVRVIAAHGARTLRVASQTYNSDS